MKPTIKHLFLIHLFALFTIFSCNEDSVQEIQNNQDQVIAPNSTLANLMTFTSSNDGSVDNILDDANCFSVNLPVTITVNSITIVINTLDDLALIEEIFEEFDNDEDILEFIFPFTITLNDYTEIVIENEEQLESFIEECLDDDDQVIECVDFVYPISFSIYNTDFQIIDTVVIESDEELYEFLENLESPSQGAVLASLNFPVTLIYANGETIQVNNNQELEEAINAAEEECEDDDDCTEEDVDMYLQECYWNIVNYNGSNDFIIYDLDFQENQILVITENGQTITSTWTTNETDEGIWIEFSGVNGGNIQILTGNWLVIDCDDDRIELIQETASGEENTMVIEQDCEEDEYDCEDLEANFGDECEINGAAGFINEDCECEVEDDEYDCEELEANFGDECEINGVVGFINDNCECEIDDDEYDCEDLQANFGDNCVTGSGESGFINDNCECESNSNPATCTEEDIDAYVVNCIWNVVNYNGSDDLIIFDFDFNVDGTVIIEGDGQTINATWSTSSNADGVWLEFGNVNGGNIQAITGNWLIVDCDEDRLEMQKENETMVIEQDCE